jgi:hypothetical protein
VFAVWTKLQGDTWNDGTAVSYVLRLEELARFSAPSWIAGSPVISNLLTFGTLAIEFALAFLIWNRNARRWVLPLGVAFHLLIDVVVTVGFFSFVLFVGYLAFVPHESMGTALLAVRDRLRRSRFGAFHRLGWAGESGESPSSLCRAPRRGSMSVRLPRRGSSGLKWRALRLLIIRRRSI